MTRLAGVLFALLVAATLAAFFVAQRLKSRPGVLVAAQGSTLLSPNRDGRFEVLELTARLREAEDVTARVVDAEGEPVRTLLEDRPVRRRERVALRWDGRDPAGRPVPDGRYRVRLVLGRAGRAITHPRTITVDTTPPVPRVLDVGPQTAPGPELLPGRPARIRFSAPGRRVSVEVWRTDRGPRPVAVLLEAEEGLGAPEGVATWDGRVAGRRIGAGTFRVVVRSRDRAGNVGTSPPARSGITVRYLAAQPPARPVRAGRPATLAVDARGAPFAWALRRVGAPDPVRRGRRTSGRPFPVATPDGASGAFLFSARTRARVTQVPVAVDDARERRVLVVLPAASWQGRNPVDDDGDGLPDTLARGVPVRIERVFARDGLPAGFARGEAPLLAFLDREGLRYDLTTDVALAAGAGPPVEGHRGVLLAGDALWVAPAVGQALRRFAIGGGTVVSTGVDALRRTVRQTADRLADPSPPAPADLFGARLGPVERRPVDLTVFSDGDLQLFAGDEGVFAGVRAWQATEALGEAEPVATAVTPRGAPVVVAARFGRGLVVRPGIAAFGSRLSTDRASAELMRRLWTLLAG